MNYDAFALTEPMLFFTGGYFSADQGWKHSPRYHRGDYELILCTNGPIYLQIGQNHYTVNTNDAVLIPPYTPMHGDRESPNHIDFYWLHFFAPSKLGRLNESQLQTFLNQFQNAKSSNTVILPRIFSMQHAEEVIILAHHTLDCMNRSAYFQQAADYFMTTLLLELSDRFLQPLIHDHHAMIISKLKEWIRANMSPELTVKDMADEVQLNPQYLSRLFKKNTGITPIQYLLKLKIETAKLLLVQTNLSIKQVAHSAYFSDEKLFMRHFKTKTGLTPTKYRAAYSHIYHNNPEIDRVLPIPKRVENKLKRDFPDMGTFLSNGN